MARLITSDNALRALLLLSQRETGLRTSEVAAALEISYTGAEKALGILVSDSLASVSGHRFVISNAARTREAIRLALAFLPANKAVAALARGNEGVEFAGADSQGIQLVLRRFVDPASERRLRESLAILREVAPGQTVEVVHKEALRTLLRTELAPRKRAQAMAILTGTVDRTFPDLTRHGDFDAQPLGRLNRNVHLPSARRLRDFARRHGVRRILAFGSATRGDFRPDSDLDLLVEAAPDRQLGLSDRTELIAAAERLFDRDVDLVVSPVRRASLAQRIARDGVVIYDAAR